MSLVLVLSTIQLLFAHSSIPLLAIKDDNIQDGGNQTLERYGPEDMILFHAQLN